MIEAKDHSLDHHDWHSRNYVFNWAERQDGKEKDRLEQFRLMAETIPYNRELPIKILDLGAGYGALTQFLLNRFPNATAVCQDSSETMAKLGQERMANIKGRFTYALCDFSKERWSEMLKGPFEAVVSSIAIHNVRSPETVRNIYHELFPLVRTGGCFLNYDRQNIPLDNQMEWLRDVGFEGVTCFWKDGSRALFGGFKNE